MLVGGVGSTGSVVVTEVSAATTTAAFGAATLGDADEMPANPMTSPTAPAALATSHERFDLMSLLWYYFQIRTNRVLLRDISIGHGC